MSKSNNTKFDTSETYMSADSKAMQHVVTALTALVSRAKKPAVLSKAERDAQHQALIRDYQTEDDVMDAYGYEMITQDECRELLDCMRAQRDPSKADLREDELYLLELQQILRAASVRLQTLKWEDLPEAEKQKILRSNEGFSERLKADRLNCESVGHQMAG